MQVNFLVLLISLKIALIFGKPINSENRQIDFAPLYGYQLLSVPTKKELLLFGQNEPPQRTEALINNTMVAGSMLYRFFRVIYRAGTILMSFMPGPPRPF